MPQTGMCVRCGRFAVLEALSYAPKFGKPRIYTRKEDKKYCESCAKALEAAKKRHEAPRGRGQCPRHYRPSRHYDDSRDRFGHKKQKYDM